MRTLCDWRRYGVNFILTHGGLSFSFVENTAKLTHKAGQASTGQVARIVHMIAPDDPREHLLLPQARRELAELVYDRSNPVEFS
jgi:hypothetical protein